MKRFLITNPKFAGTAEVVYKENGLLQKFDISQADMNADTIILFKKAIAVRVTELTAAFGKETIIVQADLEVSFKMFWLGYRKKINKLRSETLWKKLSKVDQVQAYYGIASYDKYLSKNEWRNKADPDTYLRSKYYQNEYK